MYDFKNAKGYIEVYFNGILLCTADNMQEARREVEAHQRGEF